MIQREHSLPVYFEMWNSGDAAAPEEILAPAWTDHNHPDITTPAGDSERPGRLDSPLIWLFRAENGRLRELWTYRRANP